MLYILLVGLLASISRFGAVDPLVHLSTRCKRDVSSVCFLQPEIEQGPYYWNTTSYRTNITEDRQGIPLHLTFTVIDTNNCSALINAAIDVWHCDALGIYSHYTAASLGTGTQNDNSSFLRGIQLTSSTGVASFDTIYPGWYSGRADHIHLKVHVGGVFVNSTGVYSGGHVSHTGQVFLNDTITDLLKNNISPYTNNTIARTYNSVDRVYTQQNGSYSALTLSYMNPVVGLSAGIIGSITLGINSSATPSIVATGGGGGGPGGASSSSASTTTVITGTSTVSSSTAPSFNRVACLLLFIAPVFCLSY